MKRETEREWTRFRWDREYARHFPHNTDPSSRHARIIGSEELKHRSSPARKALIAAGYDPDHWAESIQWTVKMLWDCRARLAAAKRQARKR